MQSAWEKYKHLWERVDLPAKSRLLRAGDICREVFLVRKGAARAWFDHGDKEVCFQFFFEGDVVYAAESLRKGVPSPFHIEMLESGELYRIDQAGLAVIREDAPVYNLILDRVVERQSAFMQHFFSLLKDSPRQRYEQLLSSRPEIVQRVPLQYVASYLGITQVSLSRIRSRARG